MSKNNSASPKSAAGINFEVEILDYIDRLRRDSPMYRRRSRSEIVNMIIEEHAQTSGAVAEEQIEGGQAQSA